MAVENEKEPNGCAAGPAARLAGGAAGGAPLPSEPPREGAGEALSAGGKGAHRFVVESHSSFEPALIEHVCKPVLRLLPESVHPNTISLLTSGICWATALLAVLSSHLSPLGRLLALLGAGAGMFLGMLGDCLDGMQARRTGRCSRLGEVLDHWLDAIHCPLVTVGLTAALELDAWAMVLVHITNTMVYNSQLVLQHYTGRFVHGRTSGTEAQFGVALGYIAAGVLLYVFGRRTPWVDMALIGISVVAVVVQLRLNFFYYVRLRRLVLHHLPFVLLCAAAGAMHLLGIIDRLAFLLTVVFISFRISGSYVLATIVGFRYRGFDVGLALWLVLTALAHYVVGPTTIWGVPVEPFLPYLACLYVIGRNGGDLARYFALLRPSGAPGQIGQGTRT